MKYKFRGLVATLTNTIKSINTQEKVAIFAN